MKRHRQIWQVDKLYYRMINKDTNKPVFGAISIREDGHIIYTPPSHSDIIKKVMTVLYVRKHVKAITRKYLDIVRDGNGVGVFKKCDKKLIVDFDFDNLYPSEIRSPNSVNIDSEKFTKVETMLQIGKINKNSSVYLNLPKGDSL